MVKLLDYLSIGSPMLLTEPLYVLNKEGLISDDEYMAIRNDNSNEDYKRGQDAVSKNAKYLLSKYGDFLDDQLRSRLKHKQKFTKEKIDIEAIVNKLHGKSKGKKKESYDYEGQSKKIKESAKKIKEHALKMPKHLYEPEEKMSKSEVIKKVKKLQKEILDCISHL